MAIIKTGKLTEKQASRNLTKIAVLSTFGGFLFGYDTGVINGALPFMAQPDQLNLTPFTEGLVTSSLVLGAAFGAIFTGQLTDRLGRRKVILWLAILFMIATIGCAISVNVPMMVVFRFLLGLGVGGVSASIPTYLSEMAPSEKRGRYVTIDQWMIVFGQLLAYITNTILGTTMGAEDANAWRWMTAVALIPAVILWFGMMIGPESPRWLASKGRKSEALTVLQGIRAETRAQQELKEIQESVQQQEKLDKATWKDLGIPWIRKLLLIGIGIAVVNQLTGVNSIMYYGTEILKMAGFGTDAALIANIANGAIAVIACTVGMWLLGKVRRRPMGIVGLSGIVVTLFTIGILSKVMEGSPAFPYVMIALMVTFLAFMQGSIGPITWLLISEIFPQRLRGLGVGISIFFLWIVNFIISFAYPSLLNSMGISGTFFFFGFLNILSLLFYIKYLPETKGVTLEELEAKLRATAKKEESKSENIVG